MDFSNSVFYLSPITLTEHFFEVLDSTNSEARRQYETGLAAHGSYFTCLWQSAGRGQQGSLWQGNAGENLYLSLIIETALPLEAQFGINQLVALQVLHVIREYLPEACIKWPNDIYHERKKLAGILIENQLQGNQLKACFIGIGINVLQEEFGPLTRAGSLKSCGAEIHALKEIKEKLLLRLKTSFEQGWNSREVKEDFEKNMLFSGQITTFVHESRLFEGTVYGVDEWGRLLVQEGPLMHRFNVKEVNWAAL